MGQFPPLSTERPGRTAIPQTWVQTNKYEFHRGGNCPNFFGLVRYARKKRDSLRRDPGLPAAPQALARAGGSPIFAAFFYYYLWYSKRMSRAGRIVVPGAAHHVTQRGNDHQPVFFHEDDRLRYLDCLRESVALHSVAISAYCLMTNHVHLLVIPKTEAALSKAVGHAHLLYTNHIHRTYKRSGHLWQGRFYSCPLDETHAYSVAAYVELNPVRAGMTTCAWEYPWSSAAAHCTGVEDASGLLDVGAWFEAMPTSRWRETLDVIVSADETVSQIRAHTRSGRPFGDETFLKNVEVSVGHVLPTLRGRPRKNGTVARRVP